VVVCFLGCGCLVVVQPVVCCMFVCVCAGACVCLCLFYCGFLSRFLLLNEMKRSSRAFLKKK
jgi:hypothetical protein